ncbi:hypothetical protein EVAR_67680_1 [Eumeta japonica]|uniref:Uncharacterized protein n=1 Tax=Eumeta variegata TaxID=151549 RepID=A0A4C1ZNE9_EUMVA|nr:hypothetical protein EVAR_67680_1 [Eumeta japonica]
MASTLSVTDRPERGSSLTSKLLLEPATGLVLLDTESEYKTQYTIFHSVVVSKNQCVFLRFADGAPPARRAIVAKLVAFVKTHTARPGNEPKSSVLLTGKFSQKARNPIPYLHWTAHSPTQERVQSTQTRRFVGAATEICRTG